MATRNVINVSNVEQFVDDFVQRSDHPALKHWLSSNVRRWILKHYDRADRVVLDPATGGFVLTEAQGVLRPFEGSVPDWCAAAIERGDEVVHLRLGASLRKRIDRALAALANEIEDGTPLSLDRIPFPKAEAKAKKQRHARHVERRKARLLKAAIPVYNAITGETVVRLTTPESLADEGSRMSHCVATYDYWVHRGYSEIYSVRDRDGKSRATVEVDLSNSSSGIVWQIKGFANGPVEPRYRPVLQGFIRSRDYPVEDDQDNLLTDDASFLVDPQRLEQLLVEGGGLAWLRANRFAGYKALRDAPLSLLLRTIAANAERLPDRVLNEVYRALKPNAGVYLRARRTALFSIYGIAVSLFYVELPLPLLNQVRQGTFKRSAVAGEACTIYRAAEAAVTRLALAAPDRLYALGPARRLEPWEVELLESPADVLQRSQIDVVPLRAARHLALRRAMNQAKRQCLGRRAKPCKAHTTIRGLLDGSRGQYVL